MKEYLSIANSKLLFIIAAVVFLFIVTQSLIFFRVAWKEGKRRGIAASKMLKAVKSSAVLAVLPTVPIVISLIAMAPVLGIPFPWIRLSVLGSATYELMAAGMGADVMGVEGLGGAGYTAEVFSCSAWIMTLGTVSAPLVIIFFLKRISRGYRKIKDRDSGWMGILIMAAYMGLISVFIGPSVTGGGVGLLTLVCGAAIMLACTLAERRWNLRRLKEFSLSISMVGAMALAIVFSSIHRGG